MAKSSNQSGKRGMPISGSGQKRRSPTSTSHGGSRVEPSHVTRQQRTVRAKKAARP